MRQVLPENFKKLQPAMKATKGFNAEDFQCLATFALSALHGMEQEDRIVELLALGTEYANLLADKREANTSKIVRVN